jgi:hypothetical protein
MRSFIICALHRVFVVVIVVGGGGGGGKTAPFDL